MGRLFGTDGIRGIAGEELTRELAKKVGGALTRVLKKERAKILIGMDTRESSEGLAYALADGIISSGSEAVMAGVCSTPAVAFLLRRHLCDAGVMISASHNPYNYNGIKIFGCDGFKLSDALEDEIETNLENQAVTNKNGRLSYLCSAKEEYLNYLKACFPDSLCGLKIGIDCANGSASKTAAELFCSLGAECIMMGEEPNGTNINEGCGSTHLEGLKRLVLDRGLDAGIAFDGDADRCLAVDENGREIDGDYIMALLALRMKEEKRLWENTVVGTVMSNLGFVKFCESEGIRFIGTRVGDRYVLERLNEGGYALGGEQSGHIILRDFATTGDGQLTALALLSMVKKNGRSLSTLADIMKKYPQYSVNISADQWDKLALSRDSVIKEFISNAEISLGEGGRLVIRPSGTEPLIRIMAEGEEIVSVKAVCDRLAGEIQKRLVELKSTV